MALVGTLAIALTIPATAANAATPDDPSAAFAKSPSSGSIGTNFVPRSASPDQHIDVIVEMSGDPVAVVESKHGKKLSAGERTTVKNNLKKHQDAITGTIKAKGGRVVAEMQSAYNGMQVTIPQNAVDDVAALPNVVAVYPARTYTLDNAVSVPFLGVPQVWQSTGYTGEGVKIGIIDTGIDYTHADFGGPGTAAAYAAAHANETAAADPTLFGPDAPRVKGGIDLVGDSYNADPTADTYQPVPHPDANPLDCQGHGSHVAGTAAGDGVNADGSTYTGPYDASTPSKSYGIGPGVAPQADLYAIRVFGCAGSTDVVVPAIDWAVDHGIDVINMSLGSPFGRGDDPDAVAASNAVGAGVVVVASAGNEGPSPYMSGSPAAGDGVIAVSAVDSTSSFPGASVSVGGTDVAAINANGADLGSLPSMKVAYLKDDPSTADEDESLGCSVHAYQYAGVSAGGDQLAVSQRGTCARVAKAIFAQQAGAAASLMVNNTPDYPPFEGAITSNPDDGVPYTVTIPFLGVPSTAGGTFSAAQDADATVSAADLQNPGFRGYASFTSSGPRSGDSAMGVSVAAPGVSIRSTAVGTGNDSEVLSGTSMAAPHVTGVAALAVQAHPAWSSNDVSTAIVSTADPSKVDGQDLTLGGVGLVDPAAVVATQVTASGDAYDTTNGTFREDGLNFGYQESSTTFKATKQVQLTNHGTSAATFAVSTVASAQSMKATVTPSVKSITVPAGGKAVVSVTLTAAASAVPSALTGDFGFSEFSGDVVLTSGSSTLRVPYLMVPHAVSKASQQGKASWNTKTDSTTTVSLHNPGGGITVGADFYTWGISDAQDVPKSMLDTGYDLRAVGVQSFSTGDDQLIVFAVNTYNRWSNAASDEFDIPIDVNGDGKADYTVFSADSGLVRAGEPDGYSEVFIANARTGALSSTGFYAQAPTDSSTILLPVYAGDLGLTATKGDFAYSAAGYSSVNDGYDQATGTATYNPWSPALSNGQYAELKPGGQKTGVPVDVNAAAFAAQNPLGVMVVLPDNASGASQALLIGAR